MFTANLEDGSAVSSKRDFSWIDVPTDKKITGVQLAHPLWLQNTPKQYVCLRDQDHYFFVKEAFAALGGKTMILAEILGGIDEGLKVVTMIRLEHSGTVTISNLPYAEMNFPYSRHILRPGVGRHKKQPLEKSEPIAV